MSLATASRLGALASLCALLACLLPVPAAATPDCVAYGGHMQWLGLLDLPGSVTAVAASGDRAYLTAGAAGLRIVDVSTPAAPVLLATVDTPGQARDVTLLGDYALVADGTSGLQVIWVGDPAQARIVATVPVTGDATAVAAEGVLACVGSMLGGGLLVVDLTDPEHPLARGTVAGTNILDIELQGSLAVAVRSTALDVYSLADPAAPVAVGTLPADPAPIPYNAKTFKALSVSGHLAAVAVNLTSYDFELGQNVSNEYARIVDLTVPAAPALRAGGSGSGASVCVRMDGETLYTAVTFTGGGYLSTWDVADPDAPRNLGYLALHQPGGSLAVAQGRACVAEFQLGLLDIFAVNPPTSPVITIQAEEPYFLTELRLDGDWVYGAWLAPPVGPGRQSGISRWPRSSPPDRQTVFLGTDSPASHLTIVDGWLYAAQADGILVADVTQPTVGAVGVLAEPLGAVAAVERAGSRLLAVLSRGVVVKSLADPAHPATLGHLVLPEYCLSAASRGDLAWIGGSSALHVVRVSAEGLPALVRTLPVTGEVVSLALSDQLLLAGCSLSQGLGRLLVCDLSDPENPVPVGSVLLPAAPRSLQLSGSHVYAALGSAGLAAVDVSAPAAPVLLGVAQPGPPPQFGGANGVVLAGDRLLLASLRLTTARLDCADPLPVFVPDFAAAATAGGVAITWSVGGSVSAGEFRVAAARGAQTWDVPCSPTGSGAWTATDRAAVATQGGPVLYTLWHRAAAGGGDWAVVANATWTPSPAPVLTGLLAVHPNPFNPRTTIAFALARAQPVRLSIHDLAGREVVALAAGVWPAGEHDCVWSGCDARGRAVASGSYMAVLKTEDGRSVRRLSLVR